MSEPLSVTFDTNTLDKAARPDRHPKDASQPDFKVVHAAIQRGVLRAFFCETIATLEGIQRDQRAAVLGSIYLDVKSGGSQFQADGTVRVDFRLEAVQPTRLPPHSENLRRIEAALALGFRALHAPRFGWPEINDPDRRIYVYENDENEQKSRQDRYYEAADAIERRGLGFAQIKAIAAELADAAGYGMTEPWYNSLERADQIEKSRIAAAVSEWADGDTVAAHIAYQADYICTGDKGVKAKRSVFDPIHRAWLSADYRVRFVTISELAALLRKRGDG